MEEDELQSPRPEVQEEEMDDGVESLPRERTEQKDVGRVRGSSARPQPPTEYFESLEDKGGKEERLAAVGDGVPAATAAAAENRSTSLLVSSRVLPPLLLFTSSSSSSSSSLASFHDEGVTADPVVDPASSVLLTLLLVTRRLSSLIVSSPSAADCTLASSLVFPSFLSSCFVSSSASLIGRCSLCVC